MFFAFFGSILLRSLLAWKLTEDELALGYINLLAALCMLSSSLIAGTMVDRFERRRLLILAQCVVFFSEISILLLLIFDKLTFPILMLFATSTSITYPFLMPARTAMMVAIVGKIRVAKGTALMTASVNFARMTSPALMGICADAFGFIVCYSIMMFLHFASLNFTFRLDRYPSVQQKREGFLRETLNGFVYVIKKPSIGMCILFGILPMLVVVPLQNLMVVFVEELWHHGGSGLGIMMAVMGFGGLTGSLAMTQFNERNLVKPLVVSTVIMAALLVAFAHAPYFWLGAFLVLFIYIASVTSNTIVNTAVQLMAEDHIRGRVTTVTLMSLSLAPIGTIPIAFATKQFGATPALTTAGIILAILVITLWLLSPAFRRIDSAVRNEQNQSIS